MITPEQLAKSGSEDGNQAALFCWAANSIGDYPDLVWMFAIPNGGYRHIQTAAKLKATGVKSGVPDICLLVRRKEYAALWIELKRPKNNKKTAGQVRKEQREWIKQAKKCGHGACVCYGWEQARNVILEYLNYE